MLTGDELLAKVKELRTEEPKQTTITKGQLDILWNTLEYTRATVSIRGNFESKEHPGWVEIHKSRAHQSESFLRAAIDLVNQLKKELQ
jgi:3-dehydroquinate dehydratase